MISSLSKAYSMAQDSEIRASLQVSNNNITQVKVGGKASNLSTIAIEL